MATEKTKWVRALIDLPQFEARCGDPCEVPADEVDGLKKSGYVDDSTEAVAYAKREKAKADRRAEDAGAAAGK